MGEARRRKLAGDTKPKGKEWRQHKPSKFKRYLVIGNHYNPYNK